MRAMVPPVTSGLLRADRHPATADVLALAGFEIADDETVTAVERDLLALVQQVEGLNRRDLAAGIFDNGDGAVLGPRQMRRQCQPQQRKSAPTKSR